MNANWIWLTEVPRELGKLTGGKPPSYRKCYFAILDGRINAETINGRYRVREEQLPAIAELFGLRVSASRAA